MSSFKPRLTFLFTFLAVSYLLNGQFIKEPKLIGQVHLLSPSGDPVLLERQTARLTKKMLVFERATSNVLADSTSTIKFIAKTQDNSIDPINKIRIYKIHSSTKNNYRYVPLRRDNPLKITLIDYDDLKRISPEMDPYGTSSYLISIKNAEKGEYVIKLEDDGQNWNLFGIK